MRRKIVFPVRHDSEDWPPVEHEALWAKPVFTSDHDFVLDNIPFFVRGISCYDTVYASRITDGDELVFQRVVRWGGHHTVRVVPLDGSDIGAIRSEMRKLGCTSEWSRMHSLIAMDVPPESSVADVRAWLESEASKNHIDFEEGNVAWV